MADRRMIASAIYHSDDFLELSFEAQALYSQLLLDADNFGFVTSVKRVMRTIGAHDDALDELSEKRFLLRFDSGVWLIRQWFIANYGGEASKRDRAITTKYLRELSMVFPDETGAYVLMDSNGFHTDSNCFHTEPQKQGKTYQSNPIQTKVSEYISKAMHNREKKTTTPHHR